MEHISIAGIFFFIIVLYFVCRLLLSCWVFPLLTHGRLKKNGLSGPSPTFPFGNNLSEMKKKKTNTLTSSCTNNISHDIYPTLFPHFARWKNSHGKVFVYWVGTEPFLYIADPVLLKRLSSGVSAKNWGKPTVLKRDRAPMFGNGLLMSEGDEWALCRQVMTPAFHPTNLKAMVSLMVKATGLMLDSWTQLINSGTREIDVEKSIRETAGDIIDKASFGISYQSDNHVFGKLRALQISLFQTKRLLGVPFGEFLYLKQAFEARRIGREINQLFSPIIDARKKSVTSGSSPTQPDLLGLLLNQSDQEGSCLRKTLTTQQVVDECKTFFFAGHETSALSIIWTMLLLAINTDWQTELREEIREVMGDNSDKEIDVDMFAGLKKMGWVMNEIFGLYPSGPNALRQAKDDIRVSEDLTIPKGTNMWIDIVGMHHDPELWCEDVHEFKPERFKDDIHGGCKHKMGFLPFGFGGRMCIGRNLTFLEYKIVLTLILSRFSFTISPTYCYYLSILC